MPNLLSRKRDRYSEGSSMIHNPPVQEDGRICHRSTKNSVHIAVLPPLLLLLFLQVAAAVCVGRALADEQQQHIVGDSIWSIPPSDDFYADWAAGRNASFHVGDALVFRFETGFYDVVQVSRRDFDGCAAENPFRSFIAGPATVRLNEQGVHYFICSFASYCLLGLKLSVVVHVQPPTPPL